MASEKSILSEVVGGIKRALGIGVAVAVEAEPFVDLAFPGVAQLFNSVVQQVALAEAAAVAAGAQSGTGAQKLVIVTRAIEDNVAAYERRNGIVEPLTQLQIEALANAAVAFLNALPAPPATTPPVK